MYNENKKRQFRKQLNQPIKYIQFRVKLKEKMMKKKMKKNTDQFEILWFIKRSVWFVRVYTCMVFGARVCVDGGF